MFHNTNTLRDFGTLTRARDIIGYANLLQKMHPNWDVRVLASGGGGIERHPQCGIDWADIIVSENQST